ncbi:MAG: response regulator [Xanthomonadales bacterium]|nr:response regulator [Xanthomonadales bacterium]
MEPPALHLLLVEDDPIGAHWLRHLLGGWGYAVEHAGDCQQALAVAEVKAFDGLLLDQRLPDGSGEGLLARLRAGGVCAPALALSADLDPRPRPDSGAAQFDARLRKPIAADALLHALHALGLAPPSWDEGRALAAANGHASIARALRQLMLGELPAQRAELQRAAAASPPEFEALDALLHKLLGSARLTGAMALAAHIESARSQLGDPLAAAQRASALGPLFAEIERLLREGIPSG